MSLSAKLRRAPVRIATGAYILNSGVTKFGADDDAAKSLHGMASGTYPFLGGVAPKVFARGLAVGEMAVGAALLLPIVPPVVAGAALTGLSGALLNMYWNTPGMHHEGSPRPTQQGMPFAKDVWMLGAGLGLIGDALLEPAHDRVVELEASMATKRAGRSRRTRRKAKRAALANAEHIRHAREGAIEFQAEAAKRARKAAKKARKRAETASERAAARLTEMRADYAPLVADKARAAREAARELAEEYGPLAAEKARAARDATRQAAEEYGPLAAEKARAAREAARELAEEYGPLAADKVKAAGHKAREAGTRARSRLAA
jgi:uncharacterized membrane protein YphA (DoxX/SURF4 family)